MRNEPPAADPLPPHLRWFKLLIAFAVVILAVDLIAGLLRINRCEVCGAPATNHITVVNGGLFPSHRRLCDEHAQLYFPPTSTPAASQTATSPPVHSPE